MPTKKWSDEDIVSSIIETDKLMGLVSGDNAQITISVLRAILNSIDQEFLGNVDAVSFTGYAGNMTGFGATGGVINIGSTTIGADSDADGGGIVAIQTRGITRIEVENLGGVVVNGIGANVDFRIESSTDANAFFVDGGSSKIGLGTNAPIRPLHIVASVPNIRIDDNNATTEAEVASFIEWHKADGDRVGWLGWGSTINTFFDINNETTDGEIRLLLSAAEYLTVSPIEVVINEGSLDVDFRVESDIGTDAFFVQGSDGFVGVGTASPTELLTMSANGSGGVGHPVLLFNDEDAQKGINEPFGAIEFFGNDTGGVGVGAGIRALGAADVSNGDSMDLVFAAGQCASGFTERMRLDKDGFLGLGLTPTGNMAGLSIEAGILTLKETTTPTADTNYGKIYPKSDNKLYFQDGAGVEHEIAYV